MKRPERNSNDFQSLVELLKVHSESAPDTPAYSFLADGCNEQLTLTWHQIDHRSCEVAVALGRFLNRGDRVLLVYPPGLDFVTSFLGCLRAGFIAVPISPPHPARPDDGIKRINAVAADSGAKAILTTEELSQNLLNLNCSEQGLVTIPTIATDFYGLEDVSKFNPTEFESDSIAFLQYTSGSTAAPKGVAISHGNIIHNLACIREKTALTGEQATGRKSKDVIVSWLPTFHDMGLIVGVLYPIYSKSQSYLMAPITFLQRPIRWLEAISKFKGTLSGAPNFAFDLCTNKTTPEQRQSLDLSTWRFAFNGSEPVRKNTLVSFANAFREARFQDDSFFPVYGLAESTAFVSGKRWTKNRCVDSTTLTSLNVREDIVSCGTAAKETKIAIADPDTGKELGPNQIGEIWIQSQSVAKSYWNQNGEKFLSELNAQQSETEGSFLRTGDLGFVAEGELFVTGRIKDLIIIRGSNYYPQDIEQTIEACHPMVQHNGSAATSIATADGERLGVIVETKLRGLTRSKKPSPPVNGSCSDLQEMIRAIRQAIAEMHEIQTEFIALIRRGELPRTTSGKVRRHACSLAIQHGQLSSIAEWTLTNNQIQFS